MSLYRGGIVPDGLDEDFGPTHPASDRQAADNGDVLVLRRLSRRARYYDDDGGAKKIGLLLDVETTGRRHGVDRIIELAAIPFEFSRDGRIFSVGDCLTQLEDPGIPIPQEITNLTGISDEDVRGRAIDPSAFEVLARPASLVIAHNAAFDRPFVEARLPLFEALPWACSCTQVPWRRYGIRCAKLECLAHRFGFYFDGHRGETDCLATLELLASRLPGTAKTVLSALLESARRRTIRVWATNSPFVKKDLLRARGYTWPGDGGNPRAWYIDVDEDTVQEEMEFLWGEIYHRRIDLPTATIDCFNRFSNRA
jgi:DNA polymerase-3 subunit epsilon